VSVGDWACGGALGRVRALYGLFEGKRMTPTGVGAVRVLLLPVEGTERDILPEDWFAVDDC
jgi:hypothetical protein